MYIFAQPLCTGWYDNSDLQYNTVCYVLYYHISELEISTTESEDTIYLDEEPYDPVDVQNPPINTSSYISPITP